MQKEKTKKGAETLSPTTLEEVNLANNHMREPRSSFSFI